MNRQSPGLAQFAYNVIRHSIGFNEKVFTIHVWLALGCVICCGGILVTRLGNFPNVDEVAHLPAGISHWKFERFDLYRVNPPLVRLVAAIPSTLVDYTFDWTLFTSRVGSRPEFEIGLAKLRQVRTQLGREYVAPRLMCLMFFGVLIHVLVRVLNEAVGPSAALVALIFICFCPNMLAHAPTIVPDVGSVAMGTLASYWSWLYVQTPTYGKAVRLGIGMGLALLTKLTWITGVASLALAVLACGFIFRSAFPLRCVSRRLADIGLAGLIALLILNVGYLFEDSFVPLAKYDFCSRMLGGDDCSTLVLGNRFRSGFLGQVPVPLPKNFVLGIDYLKYEVEEKKWSFLMGEWRFGSWPHYYIMTTIFKSPEPTLVGALLGTVLLVLGIWRKTVEPKVIALFLLLSVPAGVCFASVSLQGGFNHHHRYVLIIYPVLFALAAYIASPTATEFLRLSLRGLRAMQFPFAMTLAALSAASSLRVHPYYTSYFNTISGGPEHGWHLLSFSNIDWGQDILEVDRWLKAHPEHHPLVIDLDYFNMNGSLLGVTSTLPPMLPRHASIDVVRGSIPETQWWIICVRDLYNLADHDGLEYLQQIEPVEKIAYAYHVYRIDPLPIAPESPELHSP